MANAYRDNARRRGSGYRDRERDPRERDYRGTTNRERYYDNARHSSSRRGPDHRDEPGRMRDRDMRPSLPIQEAASANKSSVDKNASVISPLGRSDNASDQASVASNLSQSGTARHGREQDLRRTTDLLCKKQQWWGQGEEALKELKKIEVDRKRGEWRLPDFASADEMFDGQEKKWTNLKSKCSERILALDKEIFSSLSSFLDKHHSTTTAPFPATSSPQIQLEIEDMKKQHDSDIRQLRSQYETQNRQLIENLDKQAQKTQNLEKKLERIIKEFDSERTQKDSRISAVNAKLVASTATHDNIMATIKTHTEQITENNTNIANAREAVSKLDADTQASIASTVRVSEEVKSLVVQTGQIMEEARRRTDAIDSRVEQALTTLNAQVIDLKSSVAERSSNGKLDPHIEEILMKHDARLSSMHAELNSRKDQHEQERTASEQANQRLMVIESSLGSMETDVDKMNARGKHLDRLDATVKEYREKHDRLQDDVSEMKTEYDQLVSDLKRMEREGHSATDNAMTELKELKSTMEESESLLQEFKSTKRNLAASMHQSTGSEQHVGAVSSRSTEENNNPGYVTTSDLGVVTAQLEKLRAETATQMSKAIADTQLQLSRNSAIIGAFLDKERDAIDAAKASVTALSEKTIAIEGAIETIKQVQADFAANLQNQVSQNGTTFVSQKHEIDAARQEVRQALGGLEALQFQLSYFNAWKNNFNTRTLYKQIAEHIMATVPGSFQAQLAHMSDRISGLEAQSSEQASKKRKMPNGNAVAVNGNH